jgi:hypothetical protein
MLLLFCLASVAAEVILLQDSLTNLVKMSRLSNGYYPDSPSALSRWTMEYGLLADFPEVLTIAVEARLVATAVTFKLFNRADKLFAGSGADRFRNLEKTYNLISEAVEFTTEAHLAIVSRLEKKRMLANSHELKTILRPCWTYLTRGTPVDEGRLKDLLVKFKQTHDTTLQLQLKHELLFVNGIDLGNLDAEFFLRKTDDFRKALQIETALCDSWLFLSRKGLDYVDKLTEWQTQVFNAYSGRFQQPLDDFVDEYC